MFYSDISLLFSFPCGPWAETLGEYCLPCSHRLWILIYSTVATPTVLMEASYFPNAARCLRLETVTQRDLPHQRSSGVPPWRIIILEGAAEGRRLTAVAFGSIHGWFLTTAQLQTWKMWRTISREKNRKCPDRDAWPLRRWAPATCPPCFYFYFYFLPINARGWNAFCDDLTIKSRSFWTPAPSSPLNSQFLCQITPTSLFCPSWAWN